MNTQTSPIDRFREDLRDAITSRKANQGDVVRASGVSQGAISNFLSGKRGLSGESLLKLWPFVYGCEFTQSIQGASDAAR